MDVPKISILIPVYNRNKYIAECIQSALDQTFADFEIVIVDNHSDDGTWEICQSYAAQDSRIRIFRNETNIGPVRNWKRCFDEARGRYGKLLFSDDLIYPEFLSKTLPYITNEKVGLVFAAVNLGVHPAKVSIEYQHKSRAGLMPSGRFIRDTLIKNGDFPVSPGAALFRTKDLREFLVSNIHSPSFDDFDQHGAGPDLLLYLLIAKEYPYVAHVQEPLAFFRIHPESISVVGADTIMHSRYFQAQIWFAETNFAATSIVKRLLCRAWLDQCISEKKKLDFEFVCKRYMERPVQMVLSEKLLYAGMEAIMRMIATIRFRIFG